MKLFKCKHVETELFSVVLLPSGAHKSADGPVAYQIRLTSNCRVRREREKRLERAYGSMKQKTPTVSRSALTDLRDNKAAVAAAADGEIQRRGMAVEQCGIKIRNSKQTKKLIKRKNKSFFFHELNGPYVIGPRGVRESKSQGRASICWQLVTSARRTAYLNYPAERIVLGRKKS